MNAWVIVWAVSGSAQLVGFVWAAWLTWQVVQPGWRGFWCAFLVNWAFTLTHHVAWGLATQLIFPLDFLQAFMKLGAMLSELVVMALAMDLMTNRQGTHPMPPAAERLGHG
jgi:hypothetical protein